ncbi:MAG TPA: hypothetical protein VHJ78_02145 [Actinomycetota bacterium]|nr:hypothetical protein [Actinomycetota bacterium]
MGGTEENMGQQEERGGDFAGGSTLGRPPTPESQSTGSAEVRPDDADGELPPVVDGQEMPN